MQPNADTTPAASRTTHIPADTAPRIPPPSIAKTTRDHPSARAAGSPNGCGREGCLAPDQSHHPLRATATPGRPPPKPCRLSFAPSRREMCLELPSSTSILLDPSPKFIRGSTGKNLRQSTGLRESGHAAAPSDRTRRVSSAPCDCRDADRPAWMLIGLARSRHPVSGIRSVGDRTRSATPGSRPVRGAQHSGPDGCASRRGDPGASSRTLRSV
jgi:hypothetical protein